MAARLITLLTDFGTADLYVGTMKGVILSINPQATVVDLTHDVRPQAISQAGFLLGTAYRYFPPDAIHVVVVDPGVGTERRALLLTTSHGRFVGPDNGVLSYVVRDALAGAPPDMKGSRVALPESISAYVLDNPSYWLHPVSRTFHGRDVFAPAAAHLSLGVPPNAMGHETREIEWLQIATPKWHGDALEGEVVHVDRFGNLVTSIPAGLLADATVEIEVKGRRIRGLSRSYEEAQGLLALVGSHGNLEIALRNGSAALTTGATVGEMVTVQRWRSFS